MLILGRILQYCCRQNQQCYCSNSNISVEEQISVISIKFFLLLSFYFQSYTFYNLFRFLSLSNTHVLARRKTDMTPCPHASNDSLPTLSDLICFPDGSNNDRNLISTSLSGSPSQGLLSGGFICLDCCGRWKQVHHVLLRTNDSRRK